MLDDPVLVSDWHAVARADGLAEGQVSAARLLGEDLVLWRSAGRVSAWRDLCIHRGARLSLGHTQEGHLACAYHGWRYDASGRCVHFPAHPEQTPPAKAHVQTYPVQERYGMIWVCLGQPAHDLPDLPEAENPVYRKVLCGPFGPVNASAPRLLENFLDVAHFPYVHPSTLGDPQVPEIPEYRVETGPDGIVATAIRIYQPDPYATGEGDWVSYTYRAFRPLLGYLVKETPRGGFLSILNPVTPVDERVSLAWSYMVIAAGEETSDADLVAFESGIFAEDIVVVESQRPELLPLDLGEELHLRSDRTSVAYRRWLRELGVRLGTR